MKFNHISPSAAPAILIDKVVLRYQNTLILNNFKLTLSAGQTTVLLGPSGIGKTSLLRLIAGLHRGASLSHGVISASDGLPLSGRSSYLSQGNPLLPWLTVLDNVLIGYRLRGVKIDQKLRQQALELLAQVGLESTVGLKPDQLSGGMRQRVALVRTLLENCPIVLMDEPFSALDAVTRLQLQTLAAQFLQHRTVLLITHDPLEALRLGHQIYVMEDRPARLRAVTQPTGQVPRSFTDTKLLAMQAELFEQLLQAKAVSVC